MFPFEQFLVDKGYKPLHYDIKKNELVEGYVGISTMGNIYNSFIKDGKEIVYGLSEGKPILVRPRPNVKTIIDEDRYLICECSDDRVDRIFQSKSFDEILNEIFNWKEIVIHA